MTAAVNILAVVALVTLVVTVAVGVVDLARECWSPEPTPDTPGFRILERPYDYERDS